MASVDTTGRGKAIIIGNLLLCSSYHALRRIRETTDSIANTYGKS